jgi:hypothetical protein
MPYSPTSWVNGTTALSAAALNNIETEYTEATNSFEQDMLAAFVFSGLVATKDGTTATQLDVTAGVAFVKQTDGTLRRRAPTATNFSTSGNPSAVMYLDLNPDGTWSWGTSHSTHTGYSPIAQVTTDTSSNILTVTDERATTINLFSGALATGLQINGSPVVTTSGGSLTLTSLTVSGTATFDSKVQITITLGGANQKVLEMTATDGDDYAIVMETNGYIGIYNYTTATWMTQWTAVGTALSNVIEASGTAAFGGGNYSLIASASNGAIYSDNGNFKTSGAGTVTASLFDPILGNAGFNCRGNFSGTGSGTVSHGAGTTPGWVGITCSQSSSSMTVGAAAYTATQVTVTAGASYTWKGLAV